MSTLTRTQIYIPTDLLQQAKIKASSNNMNLSQFIRDALSSKVQTKSRSSNPLKQIKPLKLSNPIITNNPRELSKEIDSIVYGS